MKISFMLAKPPPLAQFIQLVPTSSFNLKTTSQRSTTTWEPSLTTFRRVQPHDKRSIQTKSKIQPCNAPTCLLTPFFLLNHHQHTSHRLFWSPQPPPSYFDTYFSWSNRRRCCFTYKSCGNKKKYHDAERVCRSQCTHSSVQTTSTTLFEWMRMQKCWPTTKKMALFRWKDVKKALSLMEKTKILWRFFHSTTMTLQSVTICNSALSQSTWNRPSTTLTFHPLPSNIILLSPYHVFFNCQLADSFYERIRCRNHGWKVHQSRRKSTPLTMEHGLDMW